ncbi:transketolase [Patescibacteria group bacterium]|nr:transketolase [Patescibacteria group bacterium]
MDLNKLKEISKLIRYWIIKSTTKAESGHPTSSFSAVELMVGLFFNKKFKFDLNNIANPNNDRIIFSKGHASPLFYSLWAIVGAIKEADLMCLRRFKSNLEGHPTSRFKYAEAATGSLGQGLSIGVGMAINAKYLDKLPYKTFVLIGDGEMAEGSQWEAIQLAAHYKLNNLIGILDVNRLGQCGETMYGHDIKSYKNKLKSFGWQVVVIKNGHSLPQINRAYNKALKSTKAPIMIIAKTIKGKGVSFLEDKNGYHGKVLDNNEAIKAIKELGDIDKKIRVKFLKPDNLQPNNKSIDLIKIPKYKQGEEVATRKVYGNALISIIHKFPNIVVLDGDVSNSTFSKDFKDKFPNNFFEMFIAEQNMVGTALGLSLRNKIPFVSSFSAFLTRGFDQIRMSQYSNNNVKFIGSHAGVSIGQDGPSQMGLEDISMFRSILKSVVLYPSDAMSMEKLILKAAEHKGLVYIRTTRNNTPVIYESNEDFLIGDNKIVRQSNNDKVVIIGSGITLHQAIKAYKELKEQNIFVKVIDLYSIKPINKDLLVKSIGNIKSIITVEDHYPDGGIGEAIKSILSDCDYNIYSLAVNKIPRSGATQTLLNFEEISSDAIISKTKKILRA